MSQAKDRRRERRHLHFDALVELVRKRFAKVPEQRRCPAFSLADTLMAGLALFSLKDPSLLAFQRRARDPNLRTLFGLQGVPSDTQMRQVLDEVHPDQVRPACKDVFRQLQRGKVLEDYVFLQGCYLVALDGVEYFTSKKVHCAHCMTRHHRDGTTSYYHQMLGAVVIHPDFPEVIPLAPEPIQRQDGHNKNDCERNAARRWLRRFRQDHPHLPVIVVEDALSSNAPHIRDLRAEGCHFILGVKPGDHTHLFKEFASRLEGGEAEEVEASDPDGTQHLYQFANGLSLNESNPEERVNLVLHAQVSADGKEEYGGSWVTDFGVSEGNVRRVARGGRCRWRIENETFNTLKNQGYHFEYNYGHGEENLSVVFALLMMQAFLIDQVQQRCNKLFGQAREKVGANCALWEAVRHLFYSFEVASMRQIYKAIAFGYTRPALEPLIEQARPALQPLDTS
jgi:hypothetical protein